MPEVKILVVDDEPGIRSGIARILKNYRVDYPFMDEGYSFSVLEAATGEEGIEILEQNKPDIVLLDNKLPGMQGIEVLEYIRNKQYQVVVVMITSFASLELAVKATYDGAYDFIPKPFTPQELKSSLENITKKIFLKKMTSQMKETGRQSRFQFLSVLSHELKAPLNAVEGYLGMMREKQLGNDLSAYKEAIDRSSERLKGMRTLILDLLDLTKLESGKIKRDVQKVNLVTILQTAIDTMRPYSIQKDVTVNVVAPESLEMMADADELEIIFNNLISNAIKYNIDNGKVECKLESSGGQIMLQVSDTGIGMSEAEMANLFSDFFRVKNEKTRQITGSGLGLSITKKYIEAYQGSISVTSIPEKGSTFTVIFPVNHE